MADIFLEIPFEAAHFLPNVPEGHPCGRMHGHSYRLRLGLRGPLTADGWVMDVNEVKRLLAPLIGRLDHHCLNDLEPNPTAERMARLIWDEVKPLVPYLRRVTSEAA